MVVKKPEMMQIIGLKGFGRLGFTLRFSLFLRLLTTAHARVIDATL